MLWLKLGWRNLRRNRRRTLIELASVAGSVFIAVFFVNLAFGTYSQMIESGVRIGSGHIGIYHRDYLELRRTELAIRSDDLVARLRAEPEVRAVYARLYAPGLIRSSRNSRTAVFLGIDFSMERNVNPVLARKRIEKGGIPSPDRPNGAVLGVTLAEKLGITVGNKFVMMTRGPGGEVASELFRVSGIVKTGIREFDSATVMVSRESLARVIGVPGGAHEVAVMLGGVRAIPRALPRIREIAASYPDTETYRWEDAMPGLDAMIRLDRTGLHIMLVFLYLIVGIGTVNTLLMSVMERVREFGVIRALGVRRKDIYRLVAAEAFVMALIGIVAGTVLAVLLGLYTSTKGIDISALLKVGGIAGTLVEPVIYTGWDPAAMAALGAGMAVIALAASLYPAYHVTGIRPADAMRKH